MRIMVLPCDGIGPEITEATMQVLKAADRKYGLGLEYTYEDAGVDSLEKHGITIRQETLEQARQFDGILLGPQSHMDYPPREQGGVNVSAGFVSGSTCTPTSARQEPVHPCRVGAVIWTS